MPCYKVDDDDVMIINNDDKYWQYTEWYFRTMTKYISIKCLNHEILSIMHNMSLKQSIFVQKYKELCEICLKWDEVLITNGTKQNEYEFGSTYKTWRGAVYENDTNVCKKNIKIIEL